MMARRETAAAVDAFRSACALCPAGDQVTVGCMVRLAINFIAAGASERDLVEILSRDPGKARALEPLIVALRQRTGEAVRAPAEMLEVAADIRKRIEDKAVKGILPEHDDDDGW